MVVWALVAGGIGHWVVPALVMVAAVCGRVAAVCGWVGAAAQPWWWPSNGAAPCNARSQRCSHRAALGGNRSRHECAERVFVVMSDRAWLLQCIPSRTKHPAPQGDLSCQSQGQLKAVITASGCMPAGLMPRCAVPHCPRPDLSPPQVPPVYHRAVELWGPGLQITSTWNIDT